MGSKKKFEKRKDLIGKITKKFNKKFAKQFGEDIVIAEVKDQYYNMKEKVVPVKHIVDIAEKAMKEIGIKPRYEQKLFEVSERKNRFQIVVSPEIKSEALWINQNAYFSLINLEKGKDIEYKNFLADNGVYLFLIDGSIIIDGEKIEKRDGIGISELDSFKIEAKETSEVLLMEVPMNN